VNAQHMKHLFAALVLGAALPAFDACAQDYPAKPVRLLSGFQPGGGSDIVARLLSDKLAEAWSRPVIVDNRSGAGGTIAMTIAARAPADGYTLLVISGSQITNAVFVTRVPYDLLQVYAPVAPATSAPYLLLAHPSVPADSVRDLIAFARDRPGQLHYMSSGVGSFAHLGMALFESLTGTAMVHVPYKGSGPALIDLIGGQVQLGMASAPSGMPHVRTGKLKALAVTTLKRVPLLPDLPSVAESGVPGFAVDSWYGVVAPAGTPPAIVGRLNADIGKILHAPSVAAYLARAGAVPAFGSPADLGATMRSELSKWRRVIAGAHLTLE
jgi:tripartite-type tricarboxylate transporter receptor subunit TctC